MSSSNLYFTADTHFFHENIIKYTKRPFFSVEEMNLTLKNGISLTNQDTLIHLGDFIHKKLTFVELEYFNFIKKHKKNILIIGNHDKSITNLKLLFDELYKNHYINYKGIKIELIHHPDLQNGDADLTLCGHVHNNWLYKLPGESYEFLRKGRGFDKERYVFKVPTINLGVELWNYKAIPIEKIISLYYKIRE